MVLFKKFVVMLCLTALLVPLAACEKEGEMEKAGKKLDQSIDDLKDKSKKLFD